MKRILFFFIMLLPVLIHAKHRLVTIYNTSDLLFEKANHKVNVKKILLPNLTRLLNTSSLHHKQHVFIDEYTIDASKGLVITMSDPQKQMVLDLLLDDQLTLDMHYNRKKTKKIANFPKSCNTSAKYCARALLQEENDQKQLAFAAYGHEDQELLNLHISGASGKYQLSFEQAV